jgi:hypothetical protein
MAASALRRAFTVFHFVLGLGILFLAARTAIDGVTGTHGLQPLLAIGGGIEALGAALFLFPRTLRVGGSIMLFTMTTALILDSLSRHWRIDLLIYLASTYYVIVHGAASGAPSSPPSVEA